MRLVAPASRSTPGPRQHAPAPWPAVPAAAEAPAGVGMRADPRLLPGKPRPRTLSARRADPSAVGAAGDCGSSRPAPSRRHTRLLPGSPGAAQRSSGKCGRRVRSPAPQKTRSSQDCGKQGVRRALEPPARLPRATASPLWRGRSPGPGDLGGGVPLLSAPGWRDLGSRLEVG